MSKNVDELNGMNTSNTFYDPCCDCYVYQMVYIDEEKQYKSRRYLLHYYDAESSFPKVRRKKVKQTTGIIGSIKKLWRS